MYNLKAARANITEVSTARATSAGKSATLKSPTVSSKNVTIKNEPSSSKHRKASSSDGPSMSKNGKRLGRPPNVIVQQRETGKHKRKAPGTSKVPEHDHYANGIATSSEDEHNASSEESSDDEPPYPLPISKIQKITFRVKMPQPIAQTPANIPLPRKHASFEEFLDQDEVEPRAGEFLAPEDQILKDANARHMVQSARQRQRGLEQKLEEAVPNLQREPDRQFAHYDHLLAHLGHFRKLLRKESQEHKKQAKRIAEDAVRYLEVKRHVNRVKTAEEIQQEQIARIKQRGKDVVKDLEKLWQSVEVEVNRLRLTVWEAEQHAKTKKHLDLTLEKSTQMLASRMGNGASDDESEEDEDDSEAGSTSANESNMSSEESASDEEASQHDDENLSPEALRAKYAALPDQPSFAEGIPTASAAESDTEMSTQPNGLTGNGAPSDAEEDTDPSIDMDSDISDTSEDEPDSEDAGSDEESEEDGVSDASEQNGLAGFLGKKRIADMRKESDHLQAQMQASDTSSVHQEPAEPDEMNVEPAEVISTQPSVMHGDGVPPPVLNGYAEGVPNHDSQAPSTQPSPRTSATRPSDIDSMSSPDQGVESTKPDDVAIEKASTIKTPVPSLLRGRLREYQHEGLDWLADLYVNGRNGILADEMGLGKTIQSIALLAHLAVEHEVWGPHLIVVPTSVILNWEMEFKKFCPGFKILTYYGTQEERKEKRRGWSKDNTWNVCITSYQLVLRDEIIFKRRNWHYMILDEAHNIKNFQSQRWQAMLTFKTRARLLLTGTPLQNNLTELWSLLFFLMPAEMAEQDSEGFAGLGTWSEWFGSSSKQILEHGRDTMDEEAKAQITKLHKVIRPFLLRRLKADVEKQMPGKYEHVELCRLSKRQRQLYDGFMSMAQTKEALASGNYISVMDALMQLKKVCNHPDLFEERPVTTSFTMSKSVAADFEIQDLLLRRRLLYSQESPDSVLDFMQLVPISREDQSALQVIERTKLGAYPKILALRDAQYRRTNWNMAFDGSSTSDVLASLESVGRRSRVAELGRALYYDSRKYRQRPMYGTALRRRLDIPSPGQAMARAALGQLLTRRWDGRLPTKSLNLVQSVGSRSIAMQPVIQRFACITPAVVATDMAAKSVTEAGGAAIQEGQARWMEDPFHEARTRLSVAFPDKRLLQYDCGKLQRLDRLLRDLQAGGHRALIFTQMTKVLDILEQFLNIHGLRYLRLDGATKIEQRQILTDRFNNDPKIPVFILSSRSGGLGINLTGADTVIFYDLDWNPAMDKQCTDRAHRIGQTRDVHIYRLISEHTIEANILRKSNQKRMLDDVVIQEGDFTTDYFNKINVQDAFDDEMVGGDAEASAAMDKVMGGGLGAAAFEQVEDKEDVAAARVAETEVEHADDGDFADVAPNASTGDAGVQEDPFAATNAAIAAAEVGDSDGIQHIDEYMIELMKFMLKDVPFVAPEKGKKSKKGGEHRTKRVR